MILGEIEVRAVEHARRRQGEQQVRAEPKVRWQAAMDVVKERVFAVNSLSYFAKRSGDVMRLLSSARIARHWSLVSASWTALWTSRP
ncbi:hypothetical protein [Streptomyces sp. NPDC092952]|uniref:hypothetical protein n=1 Tax=Streptomyces sp. NPDC092952 TaxID=3366018 RepID=UPI00382FA235